MKIRWRYNSKFAELLKVNAIVMYPFVFVTKASASQALIAHELEHVAQIRREGLVKFYMKYLWFYFRNLRIYKNSFKAYYNIPYEIEARAAEQSHNRTYIIQQ